MCEVGEVVNENISQLNDILVNEGAIKAQVIFFFFNFSNLFKALRLVAFIYFIYLFIFFLLNSHIKFFIFLQT